MKIELYHKVNGISKIVKSAITKLPVSLVVTYISTDQHGLDEYAINEAHLMNDLPEHFMECPFEYTSITVQKSKQSIGHYQFGLKHFRNTIKKSGYVLNI